MTPQQRDEDMPLDAQALYFREVERYQVLDRTTAAALVGLAQRGSKQARTDVVNAHLRLVIAAARHYHHQGQDLLDLIQVGNLALMGCVDRYDVDRYDSKLTWVAFATFARRAISWALADYQRTNVERPAPVTSYDAVETAETPESAAERVLADEHTYGLLRTVLAPSERYVVGRLAGFVAAPAGAERSKITSSLLAQELGCSVSWVNKLRTSTRRKLMPYLRGLSPTSEGSVLLSLSRALEIRARKTITAADASSAKDCVAAVDKLEVSLPSVVAKNRDTARGGVLCASESSTPARRTSNVRTNAKGKRTA